MTEQRRLAARTRSGGTRLDNLRLRARVVSALRRALERRGSMEVETPVLVRAPGTDPFIEPVEVPGYGYLATSPEFQMKRLLVGGAGRIHFIGPAFRAGEHGPHHDVEFTIAEWYLPGADYRVLMDEMEELLAEVARQSTGSETAQGPSGRVDLSPGWERLTVADAFGRLAGLSICDDTAEFRRRAVAAGVRVPDDARWEEVFFRVFVERVEPGLAGHRPVILLDWPARLAALARLRRDGESVVAERFEVYAGGLELANGFSELVDPVEQAERFARDTEARRRLGRPTYPIDEKFLEALREGMPESAGVALGVDRLVMLLAGAREIREVRAFVSEEL